MLRPVSALGIDVVTKFNGKAPSGFVMASFGKDAEGKAGQ
jgi:hypothetical protein